MALTDNFSPAASRSWSVEFNNESMQTGLSITKTFDANAPQLGNDATAEASLGWKPPEV